MEWRRLLFAFVYLLFIFVLIVAAFRLYLFLSFGISADDFSNRVDVDQLFYGELYRRKVFSARTGSETRVLVLGGSAAEQLLGRIKDPLVAATDTDVRVDNVGFSAHTSRDSLNKLRVLKERKVEHDVLLIYHGINDARMNCVAPGLFRDDYQHCSWYQSYARMKKTGRVDGIRKIGEVVDQAIGLGEPESEQLKYGSDIKTETSLRIHIEEAIDLAESMKAKVVLMTFATHFVDNYSREDFEARRLGYVDGAYQLPIEVWGLPRNVEKAVNIHNQVIRNLAEERSLPLIDMNTELNRIEYFSDVCHLSPLGIERFAQVVCEHAAKHTWLGKK